MDIFGSKNRAYLDEEKCDNICSQKYDTGDKDQATIEEDCRHKEHDQIAFVFSLSELCSCPLEKGPIHLFEFFSAPFISLDAVEWCEK